MSLIPTISVPSLGLLTPLPQRGCIFAGRPNTHPIAENTIELVKRLKSKGVGIISVEQDARSIPYTLLSTKIDFPVAIVVGNETGGISESVLAASDVIVELPMFGVNKSLNVWGSAAVVAYQVLESLILKPYARKKKV